MDTETNVFCMVAMATYRTYQLDGDQVILFYTHTHEIYEKIQ